MNKRSTNDCINVFWENLNEEDEDPNQFICNSTKVLVFYLPAEFLIKGADYIGDFLSDPSASTWKVIMQVILYSCAAEYRRLDEVNITGSHMHCFLESIYPPISINESITTKESPHPVMWKLWIFSDDAVDLNKGLDYMLEKNSEFYDKYKENDFGLLNSTKKKNDDKNKNESEKNEQHGKHNQEATKGKKRTLEQYKKQLSEESKFALVNTPSAWIKLYCSLYNGFDYSKDDTINDKISFTGNEQSYSMYSIFNPIQSFMRMQGLRKTEWNGDLKNNSNYNTNIRQSNPLEYMTTDRTTIQKTTWQFPSLNGEYRHILRIKPYEMNPSIFCRKLLPNKQLVSRSEYIQQLFNTLASLPDNWQEKNREALGFNKEGFRNVSPQLLDLQREFLDGSNLPDPSMGTQPSPYKLNNLLVDYAYMNNQETPDSMAPKPLSCLDMCRERNLKRLREMELSKPKDESYASMYSRYQDEAFDNFMGMQWNEKSDMSDTSRSFYNYMAKNQNKLINGLNKNIMYDSDYTSFSNWIGRMYSIVGITFRISHTHSLWFKVMLALRDAVRPVPGLHLNLLIWGESDSSKSHTVKLTQEIAIPNTIKHITSKTKNADTPSQDQKDFAEVWHETPDELLRKTKDGDDYLSALKMRLTEGLQNRSYIEVNDVTHERTNRETKTIFTGSVIFITNLNIWEIDDTILSRFLVHKSISNTDDSRTSAFAAQEAALTPAQKKEKNIFIDSFRKDSLAGCLTEQLIYTAALPGVNLNAATDEFNQLSLILYNMGHRKLKSRDIFRLSTMSRNSAIWWHVNRILDSPFSKNYGKRFDVKQLKDLTGRAIITHDIIINTISNTCNNYIDSEEIVILSAMFKLFERMPTKMYQKVSKDSPNDNYDNPIVSNDKERNISGRSDRPSRFFSSNYSTGCAVAMEDNYNYVAFPFTDRTVYYESVSKECKIVDSNTTINIKTFYNLFNRKTIVYSKQYSKNAEGKVVLNECSDLMPTRKYFMHTNHIKGKSGTIYIHMSLLQEQCSLEHQLKNIIYKMTHKYTIPRSIIVAHLQEKHDGSIPMAMSIDIKALNINNRTRIEKNHANASKNQLKIVFAGMDSLLKKFRTEEPNRYIYNMDYDSIAIGHTMNELGIKLSSNILNDLHPKMLDLKEKATIENLDDSFSDIKFGNCNFTDTENTTDTSPSVDFDIDTDDEEFISRNSSMFVSNRFNNLEERNDDITSTTSENKEVYFDEEVGNLIDTRKFPTIKQFNINDTSEYTCDVEDFDYRKYFKELLYQPLSSISSRFNPDSGDISYPDEHVRSNHRVSVRNTSVPYRSGRNNNNHVNLLNEDDETLNNSISSPDAPPISDKRATRIAQHNQQLRTRRYNLSTKHTHDSMDNNLSKNNDTHTQEQRKKRETTIQSLRKRPCLQSVRKSSSNDTSVVDDDDTMSIDKDDVSTDEDQNENEIENEDENDNDDQNEEEMEDEDENNDSDQNEDEDENEDEDDNDELIAPRNLHWYEKSITQQLGPNVYRFTTKELDKAKNSGKQSTHDGVRTRRMTSEVQKVVQTSSDSSEDEPCISFIKQK